MGQFLSFMMPVASVSVAQLDGDRCAAADWFPEGAAADTVGLALRVTKGGTAALLAQMTGGGARGAALDQYLGLPADFHAVAHVLYYDAQPSGCLIACRRGDWAEEELALLLRTRDRLSATHMQRLSMESTTRNSFVFNTMMDSMKAHVYVTDPKTDRILFMNQTMKDEFHIVDPEGRPCYEVLQKGICRRCAFCPVDRLLRSTEEHPTVQWDEVNTKTGRSYHNYDSLIHWLDGSLVHLQQSIDVTDLKTANTDELTQLMNRRTGKEALAATLTRARAEARTVTVCLFDINNLKLVNDQFGHIEGDRLITTVVSAVKELLREGEYAFRMSGDEFVAVFRTGEKDASQRMATAQEALRRQEGQYDVGFCFGPVEIAPDHTVGVEEVILLSDERMYKQKRKFHIARNAARLRPSPQGLGAASFRYDKERLYDALAQSTDDYPFLCNMKTGVFRYAPAMVEEFGLPGEVLENAAAVWGARVHEGDKAAFLEANQIIADGRGTSHCVEYRAMNRRGEWVWVRCRGQVELDELGQPSLFAGFISPLGKRNKIDHLTGLFNKLELEERIRLHTEHSPDGTLGFLVLGLDDLKHVNDLYDRAFGDEVIRITAQRLQSLLPDGAELYRLDGDELGVLVRGISAHELHLLSRTICYSFESQQEHNGKKFYCTLSGGSVLYPQDANNFLDMAKYSTYCLSLAKRRGKNTCVAYTPGILDHHARWLEMAEDLRSSIRNGFEGFSLRYQPLVQADTGRLLGAETLLRWNSGRFGAVSPVEFIPLLEQTGMIIPVGKWVLDNAVRSCAPWLRYQEDFVLNVNLSYLQIQGTDLAPFVLRILEESAFPCENLVLELTEGHFIRDNHHVQEIFSQLRRAGVRIAVDDFGTGFSSLSILKEIPADVVKIDRTFISNIRSSSFDVTFIRLVVELCHDVGLSVCLEGVETEEEYAIVKNMGLDMLQGFLFARPITGDEFVQQFFPAP